MPSQSIILAIRCAEGSQGHRREGKGQWSWAGRLGDEIESHHWTKGRGSLSYRL